MLTQYTGTFPWSHSTMEWLFFTSVGKWPNQYQCRFQKSLTCLILYLKFSPPASEGWRKVIISHCPHLGGGVPHPANGGRGVNPIPGLDGEGVPHSANCGGGISIPGLDLGGYPILLTGGVPHPRSGWGTPLIRRQISIVSTCYVAGSMPLAFRGTFLYLLLPTSKVEEGTSSQVQMGGVPYPRSRQGGYYPSQVWMVGGIPRVPPGQIWMVGGTPPARSWWWGYPLATSGWWGVPWVPLPPRLARSGWGTPQPHKTEQHSEHLLPSERYASCVHAGRLSCSVLLLPEIKRMYRDHRDRCVYRSDAKFELLEGRNYILGMQILLYHM